MHNGLGGTSRYGKRLLAWLLVLGPLAGCGGHGSPVAAPPSAAPEPRPTEAAAPVASADPPPAPAPEIVLILDGGAWERGSLLGSATTTPPATRGGFPRLNRMGDELRSLFARCECGERPVALSVNEDVPTWQLLTVLGLVKTAGFEAVQLSYAGGSVQVLLNDEGRSATFFVVAETSLASWWQAAVAAAAGQDGSVAFVLDPGPAEPPSSPPRAGAMLPIGRIAPEQVNQRISIGYGPIYSCLALFPTSPEPSKSLELEIEIEPRGVVKNINASGDLAVSPLGVCVRGALKRVAFPAPTGRVLLKYPFSLTD